MSSKPRAQLGAFGQRFSLVLLTLLGASGPAAAHHHHRHLAYSGSVSATNPQMDAALVVDGATGKALYARNADALRHPASLTKMMTLYLLFDALKAGRVSMSTPFAVSSHAAAQKPTNLHLSSGDQIPVETAIRAIVVRSANDVAVTIAENLGGTESHFAELMTAKAREFGMHSTYFHNASGLPDALQITSASDLAILARHLAYDYPQYFHYFSIAGFYYRGTYYPTHDNLIGRYDGADGIKTGYTGTSGFNLVSSVVRGGTHIIGVVMGGRTAHMRDRAMVAMLDNTFSQISQNPTLVASAQVPWRSSTLALNSGSPIQINAAGTNQSAAAAGLSGPIAAPTPQAGQNLAMIAPPALPAQSDDEDAAESKTNEGNLGLAPQFVMPQVNYAVAAVPKPPAAAPAPDVAVAALIKPRHKPAQFEEKPYSGKLVAVAAVAPRTKPALPPVLPVATQHNEVGEGDISEETPKAFVATAAVANVPRATAAAPRGGWMIQIGAFANQTLARAQLASYAEKSMDVLGQAARLVVPFQSVDGHTMYRARFGPFDEREARQVCSRMSQRGQTCFASVATR